MKKIIILLLFPATIILSSCGKLNPEEVKTLIIKGEKDRVPLLIQQVPIIDNISIDSVHLNVEDEPMSGYIYTTWTSEGKMKSIMVPVNNIHKSKEHKGYIEWESDWVAATTGFTLQSFYN